ncbi:GNAT family N-acetyltransferase [Crenobacter sp. HX-7-9]|uniref:GNAT family N-acetyltransferase n=1 Tax=Crenobacter caeni TaxID=2705474 RepID=A0A6B2KT89_9NEIS|nr:GNAT family N-acetyltransferase [Crenobacter caeni]NDV13270.1 GNAT family N-acetyltransferase [Crenobacter caeni]
MSIRPFRVADALALREVFASSVHGLACRDYTPAQCRAWAPVLDAKAQHAWCEAMARRQPFVVEVGGVIAAYADLQDDGLIDHFFVAAPYAGQGIGRRLLGHLQAEATARGLPRVYADVSLCAEALFAHLGFEVEARRLVLLRDETFANARMAWPVPALAHGEGRP